MADLTQKRQHLAAKMVESSTQLIDALNALLDLAVEKEALTSPFVDADFAADFRGISLRHLTPANIDSIVGAARAIDTWMSADGGVTSDFARNRLLEVRA